MSITASASTTIAVPVRPLPCAPPAALDVPARDAPAHAQSAPEAVPAPHSPAHRLLEGAGIVVAYGLVALALGRSVWAITVSVEGRGTGLAFVMLAAVLAGYVAADLFSGLVHFTFDRFFSTKTPFLGAAFVSPFRIHHSDPKDITRHGFLETNGNCCLATLPVLLPLALFPFDLSSPATLFLVDTMTFAAVATFLTNQFHKWAHTPPAALPAFARWAQRRGLVLSPEHHAVHHTAPHETHYCITTGWLNEPLMQVNLWRRIEQAAEALGAKVHRG